MRKLACGLLYLAASLVPAAAQAPDKASGQPSGKALSVFPVKEAWPTLDAARLAPCDDSEWAQTIAEIKAANPEQDADKQIAAGDFSLKSAGASTSIYIRVQTWRVEGPSGVWVGTVVRGPGATRCKLPVEQVQAFPILHGANNRIANTWCGRAALVLGVDYANHFNKRVVEHQAYPHKDVCTVVLAGGRGQTAGSISDRPTPEMIPTQIPDIATAARFGLTEQVAKFIADGADLAQRDMFGFDALKWSVVRDYNAAFDLIIAANGAPDFCAALKAAIEYDRVEPAALLARRCTSREERWKLLEPAMTRGLIEVVRPLIDTEPVLHLSEPRVAEALRKAASAGRVELVRLLLRHTSDELWETLRQDLLLIAVNRQQVGIISLLLERGADPDPALRFAFQRKLHASMRALAGHGIDLNKPLPLRPQKARIVDAQFDPMGRPRLPPADDDPPIFDALHPLMDFKMVDLLLELGASPNVRDGSGRTPLMIAITHSHIYGKKGGASWIERFVPQRLLEGQENWAHRGVEPVRAMLAKGADVTLADHAGLTALHHAARSDYAVEIARLLLTRGADVNARDASGKTPLDHAVEAKLVRMPEMLAKSGARSGAR